ncbi:MAG TPA: glycosyltransferase, partial [Solirubrobacteraceae bacterium]
AARAAGIQEDVRLLGFQPPEELEGLYTLASCVVLPSLYEGFGLPVLEAMSRGVPVACSDIPALREVAGEAALFFAPTAAGQIASVIGRLTRDEVLRRRLADAGLRHAATFTWTKAAEATLDCYRRTLDKGRPAA